MADRCKLFILVLAIVLFAPGRASHAGEPVVICCEPWPLWLYETGGEGQQKKRTVGLHLQNFRMMSEITGLKFKFVILPWKRCLRDVAGYSNIGEPEIAIDASFSEERAKKYHYVGPMYAISTAVFWSRERFPNGPISEESGKVITWINEMAKYRICGLLGYNYDMYYVEHGIPRSNQVIRTGGGFQGAFRMLSVGRCDLIETHPVNVIGDILTKDMQMPKDIACNKMSEDPEAFYMMVSKTSPRAKELVYRLSTALIYLRRTLQWKQITDEGVLPQSPATKMLRRCM